MTKKKRYKGYSPEFKREALLRPVKKAKKRAVLDFSGRLWMVNWW